MLALVQSTTDIPKFSYVPVPESLPTLNVSASIDGGVKGLGVKCIDDTPKNDRVTRNARFFRASVRSSVLVLTERMLEDVWRVMWGVPGSYAGRFFMLMDDHAMNTDVPMYDQLLQACAAEIVCPDAVVDVAERAIRALLGEVLFVLLTPNHRVILDTPALIVRVLRAHGFTDTRFSMIWAKRESDVSTAAGSDDDCKVGPFIERFACFFHACFFHADACPLQAARDATKAASAAVAVLGRSYAGRFFMLMGDHAVNTYVPMCEQLLQASAKASVCSACGFLRTR
jgi:hypothetical protein